MSKYIGPSLPPHLQHLGNTEDDEESEDDVNIGPAMPTHMKHRGNAKEHEKDNESMSSDEDAGIGPALPKHLKRRGDAARDESAASKKTSGEVEIGPSLPPHLRHHAGSANPDSDSTPESDSGDEFLQLHHSDDSDVGSDTEQSRNKVNLYGPPLPPGYSTDTRAAAAPSAGCSKPPPQRASLIGPALPPGLTLNVADVADVDEEDSDDDVVGPLPLPDGTEADPAYLREQLERRALRMKRRLRGEEEEDLGVVKRDTWMLELPPDRATEFGLGPRQFRARAKLDPGDRSVWTDTPEDQQRKQANPAPVDDSANLDELQRQVILERDRAMQKMTDKHNKKKRKESLVEMHQKKLRKKQKKEEEKLKGKKKERRPFDRDVDLQANRFDEAQKQAVLRKAQMLDDRFSRGNSKFL